MEQINAIPGIVFQRRAFAQKAFADKQNEFAETWFIFPYEKSETEISVGIEFN